MKRLHHFYEWTFSAENNDDKRYISFCHNKSLRCQTYTLQYNLRTKSRKFEGWIPLEPGMRRSLLQSCKHVFRLIMGYSDVAHGTNSKLTHHKIFGSNVLISRCFWPKGHEKASNLLIWNLRGRMVLQLHNTVTQQRLVEIKNMETFKVFFENIIALHQFLAILQDNEIDNDDGYTSNTIWYPFDLIKHCDIRKKRPSTWLVDE